MSFLFHFSFIHLGWWCHLQKVQPPRG